MRTKTLLLTAAVVAAGFTAVSAQSVYSVNAVGYVNLNIGNGFTMIANPLNTTNNTIGSLFPASFPDFSNLYKWNEVTQGFDIATYFFGSWDLPNITLNPGEGAFVNTTTPFTLTFVGEVMQGELTNSVPSLFAIRGSKVPQSGTTTALGLTVGDFDNLYKWNTANQGYDIYTYFFGAWSPSEPTIAVGESFFLNSNAPYEWTRTFSVN